jgi:hypothetical protein
MGRGKLQEMDSEKFDAAIEAALADELAKVNGQLPMADVKNMMKIRGVVERFIDQVKKDPNRGVTYPGINWGDFSLHEVQKVILLSGGHYYGVLCEEASSNSSEMIRAIYTEVKEKLGMEIDVRLEW